MEITVVTKNGCNHDCTTKEQLDRFLAAGWKKKPKGKPAGEGKENPEKENGAENGGENKESSSEETEN